MGFLIGLFTVFMVLDCIVLVFLVLIQLPKKEAGAGLAFGAGATDALFGAGSGTVLTKITKYSAGIFFGLAILLSILQSHSHGQRETEFQRRLQSGRSSSSLPPVAPSRPTAPASNAPAETTPAAGTNTLLNFPPQSTATNTVPILTNSPAAPATPPATNK